MPLADPVVDWSTLLKVVASALAAGIGVTGVFALAIFGGTRFAEMRRGGRAGAAGAYGLMALLALAACAGAVVLGIVVMTTK